MNTQPQTSAQEVRLCKLKWCGSHFIPKRRDQRICPACIEWLPIMRLHRLIASRRR